MKTKITSFFLTLAIAFPLYQACAQYRSDIEPKSTTKNSYIDFSSGIDNYSGLFGLGLQMPFNDDSSLRTGLGIGSWGLKFSVGIKYESLTTNGWGFGLGYSHCPGLSNMNLTFTDPSGSHKVVNIDLLQAGSVNLTVNRNWVFRGNKIFYLETGYALETGRSEFYRHNSGPSLSFEEEQVLAILKPGGIVLAVGFLVGL